MGILKDFSNNIPTDKQKQASPHDQDCDIVLRDCVGLVGECNIVTKIEECNTFIRDPNDNDSNSGSCPNCSENNKIIAKALGYIIHRIDQIVVHLGLEQEIEEKK